ncbi:NACHT, LRR and PYD domains-containing protein 5 [Hondaea fermentalgiana]|uniref:NACHT, LRR and PYD domains-containing protein 5 n=1 Tax=Hondaea fermentalgiana TaxID=2315210 RepID=A0A2R5GED1_9STRA|nr:NACHT, LRR and PYD domains-containing protein 5 [Hondaea fermentalgiana]|eukprot:GBG26983.1 NACHT, LRR and PYD domains-containing protein 5 [Hondaea fermentalgiana]
MGTEPVPHRLPKKQLERWRKEQRKKDLKNPSVLARAARSKLAPVPVRGAEAVLGSLPPLCTRDETCPEGIFPLSRPERRRNELLRIDELARQERKHYGRKRRARENAAARRIQAKYKHWKGIAKMADFASELQKRMEAKAQLEAQRERERKLQAKAALWLQEVNKLPPSPLRDALALLTSMDDPYELHTIGWRGRMAETLDALAVFVHAKSVTLERCGFGARKKLKERLEIARELGNALGVQAELFSLSLRDSKFEDAELQTLLSALVLSKKRLRSLDLHGNWLGRGRCEGTDDAGNPVYQVASHAALALASLVRNSPYLHTLDLGGNFMGPKCYATFVNNQAFSRPRGLLRIDLGFNALGDRLGAAPYALAHMICACPSLAHLNLQSNGLGAHALATIVKSLALHKNLRELELADNRLGDRGAALMCQILKSSRSLARLGLAGNEFSEIGFQNLAGTLERAAPRQLKHLDLSRNPISDQESCTRAMAALAELIRTNTSLQSLMLRQVGLVRFRKLQPACRKAEIRHTLEPATVLMSTLEQNRSLLLLDLGGNSLDSNQAFPAAIATAIVRERIACRPALRFEKASQVLIAALFKKYLTDPPDPRAVARGGLIDRIVFRILAFAVDQRTILI